MNQNFTSCCYRFFARIVFFSCLLFSFLLGSQAICLGQTATLRPNSNGVIYVRPAGTGNGSSWSAATSNLQGAIDAEGVSQVFVAVGTYNVPTSNSFTLKNGVAVFGGFDPDKGVFDLTGERILPNRGSAEGSILKGNYKGSVVKNVFTKANQMISSAVLDGFTLTAGKAAEGGGVNNIWATPLLRNLVIKGNTATGTGGGIFTDSALIALGVSEPNFQNIIVKNNISMYGGGICFNASSNGLVNVLITGNTATTEGAAIYNNRGSNMLINCTIAQNVGTTAVRGDDGVALINSVLFGRSTNLSSPLYSLIEGLNSNESGNKSSEGLSISQVFKNPSTGDFSLASGSVAIDAGMRTIFEGLTFLNENSADLAGKYREAGASIDMGAYESGSATVNVGAVGIVPDASGIIYVREGGTGKGSSWSDAVGNIQSAINGNGVKKVYVATGNYKVPVTGGLMLKNNVAVYGGFDPDNGISTLDSTRFMQCQGAIKGSVLQGNGSGSVIKNNFSATSMLNYTAILDGFTITGGEAENGGGIYNSYASPTLKNLLITGNTATENGGGIYYGNSNNANPSQLALIVNVKISANTAVHGAGVYISNSNQRFANTEITGNTASGAGSAFYSPDGVVYLVNATIAGNKSTASGADSVAVVCASNIMSLNSIVFGGISGEMTAQNSLIGGVDDIANGNLDGTNLAEGQVFNNPANADYRLLAGAVAISAASAANYTLFTSLSTATSSDLVGNQRVAGTAMDLGAQESNASELVQAGSTLAADERGIIYVKAGSTGNGRSWDNATGDLQGAIDAAGVSQVYVATGTYRVPNSGSFGLKSNVAVYGGFDPDHGIVNLDSLRILPNKDTAQGAVLLGDGAHSVVRNIGQPGDMMDISARLDGFTITGGEAENGGGIYNQYASPLLNNLVIKNNRATANGGGLYYDYGLSSNASQLATIISCQIINNQAANGGGVYLSTSSQRLASVLVAGNSATDDGAALYNVGGNTFVANTTIINNAAVHAIVGDDKVMMVNSIVFGGITGVAIKTACLIEGQAAVNPGDLDGTSITAAQLFKDPSHQDYTLLAGTACEDAGQMNLYTQFTGMNETSKDLATNLRVAGVTIDVGAYEYGSNDGNTENGLSPDGNGIIYVKAGATGTGISWNSAAGDLQAAINAKGVLRVYVAIGVYDVPLTNSFNMKENVAIYGGFDPDNGVVGLDDNRILACQGKGLGDGSVLQGNGKASVIKNSFGLTNMLTNTAVLDGFTITGGKAENGGGIYNNFAAPTLHNLLIKNNIAMANGGGIYYYYSLNASAITGGVTLVDRVKLEGNTAVNGAGVYGNTSIITMANVLITGNTATGDGGAIYSETGSGFRCSNLTVADNTSQGGYAVVGSGNALVNAIVFGHVNGSASLVSIIDGNLSSLGVMTTSGNLMEMLQASIIDNTGSSMVYSESEVFKNPAAGDYTLNWNSPAINAGKMDLATTFGGISADGYDLAGNDRVIVKVLDLGALEAPKMNLADNILYVNQNVRGGQGDGTSWGNAIADLSDALKYVQRFGDYTAEAPLKIFVAKGTYKPKYVTGVASSMTVSNRDKSFNLLPNVQLYGGFDPANNIKALSDTRLTGDYGTILSGDIGVAGQDSDNVFHVVLAIGAVDSAMLDGFTITGGNANGTDYLISNYSISGDMTDLYFSMQGLGGGYYSYKSSPGLNNVVIKNNNGGGMLNWYSNSRLNNVSIINNQAGVNVGRDTSLIALAGGGIFNIVCSLKITGGTISNNSSIVGAGICNSQDSSTYTNVKIMGNTASLAGGGMMNMSSMTRIQGGEISGNTVISGPGGGIVSESGSVEINGVTIKNNQATTYGGGVYADNSALYLSGSTLSGNKAGTSGGGLYLGNSVPVLSNLIITGNVAGRGGAICDTSVSDMYLSRVKISGNTGGASGGILGLSETNIIGEDVEITGNTATADVLINGNGISQMGSGSVIKLVNATIAGNTGGTDNMSIETEGNVALYNSIAYGGITAFAGTDYQYSLIEGSTATANGNLNATGVTLGNIFKNPAGGDYTLKGNAPAINHGNNSLYGTLTDSTLDLSGKHRVYHFNKSGIIDMGAYEYQGIVVHPDASGVVYVGTAALGKQDGSSWDDATNDLQSAINGVDVSRVYVRIGTYTVGDDSYIMKEGVGIYGGFDPDHHIKTLDDKRIAPVMNLLDTAGSILSGNHTRPVIWNVDNAVGSTAVLDGFVITGAAGTKNQGAIYNSGTSPRLKNLLITGNNTNGVYGINANPTLINVCISNNSLAGLFQTQTSVTNLINTTIVANDDAAISIVGGTVEASNSIIGGRIDGTSYLTRNYSVTLTDQDQLKTLFNNYDSQDYTLPYNSTAVDAGSNSLYSGVSTTTRDLGSHARLYNGTIDQGAYEFSVYPDSSGIVYLKTSATGNHTGSSWANASSDVQGGINALDVRKVFVASGTYTVGDNSFIMKSGVAIYGGFEPNNRVTTLADKRTSPSLTAGSILNGNNTRPVIWNVSNGLNATAVLDGFTITNAAGTQQGAVYNSYSSPTLSNLMIAANNTTGIYNSNSAPVVTGVLISQNTLGIYQNGGAAVLNNTTIAGNGNSSLDAGKAIALISGSLTANNSLICGSVLNNSGTDVLNSVTNNYSLMTADNELITGLFNDYGNNDYSLKASSAATGAGSNTLYPALRQAATDTSDLSRDLAGHLRLYGAVIDQGAYEFNLYPGRSGIIYVKPQGTGNKDGSSWQSATDDLQGAIDAAGVRQVFVATGRYTVGANSYIMKEGVGIYGGFDPDHNIKTLEDARIAPGLSSGSILDGNNTRPVIWNYNNGLSNSAVLDGFTLTGAAGTNEGSLFNYNSNPLLKNLLIAANGTSAGIYNRSAAPVILNVAITGNNGSGLYQNAGSAMVTTTLINTTIAGNTGNAVEIAGGSLLAQNSLIAGGVTGAAGITADHSLVSTDNSIYPGWFADFSNGDYRLSYNSPGVNAGNNTLYLNQDADLATTSKDLLNNSRLFGTDIDMGAYELGLSADPAGIIYISSTGAGLANGSSWDNPAAMASLQAAIDAPGVRQVFLAVGTYHLTSSLKMKNGVSVYGGFDPANGIKTLSDSRIMPAGLMAATSNGSSSNISSGSSSADRRNTGAGVQINAGSGTVISSAALHNPAITAVAMASAKMTHTLADAGSGSTATLASGTTLTGTILDGGGLVRVIDNNFTATTALDNSAVLDGVTVRRGYASGGNGGGIRNVYASPTILNTLFTENKAGVLNYGGAMYNNYSAPVVTNSRFTSDTAGYGGAVATDQGSPVFTRSSFEGNYGMVYGGAVYNGGANTQFETSLFTRNEAPRAGVMYGASGTLNLLGVALTGNTTELTSSGAIVLLSSGNSFTNLTLAGNSENGALGVVTSGGGAYTLQNAILWDAITGSNYTASYSLIKGESSTADNNIDGSTLTDDAVFYSPATGNYTLQTNGPAVNVGNNSLYTGLMATTLDLSGHPRLSGLSIDLGAYEYTDGANPVTLTRFTGAVKNRVATLTWSTALEVSFDHFELEKAVDINTATSWQKLTSIAASGKAAGSNYRYAAGQTESTAYYRLAMVDQDGSKAYSRIVTLSQEGNSTVENDEKAIIYPNPAKDFIYIKLSGSVTVMSVYNTAGLKLLSRSLSAGVNRIDISQLKAGVYYVLVGGQKMKLIKF